MYIVHILHVQEVLPHSATLPYKMGRDLQDIQYVDYSREKQKEIKIVDEKKTYLQNATRQGERPKLTANEVAPIIPIKLLMSE